MSARRTALLTVAVAVAVVVADQITKAIVRSEISRVEEIDLVLGIKLIHTRNTGVAFSLFSGGGPVIVIVAVVALAALLFFFLTHLGRPLVWLPTGLFLGGAAGNLIDRVRLGAVTDFVKIPHWPAFNVADICITFGVLTLLWVVERGK
ncbi:MAG TPA: signal peptidase II [Solirubrobacter sp.]|nr:signal peptidase II [Solirubrobacter sp.]